MNECMNIKEASGYLGISESYIRSHLKKGFIDSNQHGYAIRLKASEVDVFLLPFEPFERESDIFQEMIADRFRSPSLSAIPYTRSSETPYIKKKWQKWTKPLG
jgi:excisionase family DNA binding protein